MRQALVAFVRLSVRWILIFVLILVAVIGIALLASMDRGPRDVAAEARLLGLVVLGLTVLGAALWARTWVGNARRTGALDALRARWSEDPSWRFRVYAWSSVVAFDVLTIALYGRAVWFPGVIVLGVFAMPVAFAVMMCAFGWVIVRIFLFFIGFFTGEFWVPPLSHFIGPPISFAATYLVPIGVRIGLPVAAVLMAIAGVGSIVT